MLGRAQIRVLERSLRAARARLERSMQRVRPPRSALRLRGTLLSRSDGENARPVVIGARTLSRHQDIVRALRRLEEGTYGVCAACQGAITFGRLLATPTATHCAACAIRSAR